VGVWDLGENVKGSLEKEKKNSFYLGFFGSKKVWRFVEICGDIVLHFHACFLKSFFSIGFYIGSVLCS